MRRKERRELVVLVIDDTFSMRQYLAALLGQNGVDRVLEASDGMRALHVMRETRPPVDIVFCDLAMPNMDGVDTLRRIALAHPHVSVVVFSGLDPRVLSAVAQMSEIQGLEVLGVLGKPFTGDEVGALLDRWRVARRTSVRVQRAELMAEEIELALAEDRIDVYYQPKTRMADGQVTGVEALVRLYDPHLGVLGPAAFLPVCEASGLIPALTWRVFEKALEQASLWLAEGLPLDLAVNLSPSVMRRLDLADSIAALALKHRFPADRLTLEITESRMEVGPELLHNAARLRVKGFNLSVDDFGTGDSGLPRLRSLPFTELKIDGSFVADAPDREDLRTLLRTSIDLGHRLHMNVVAEGVEQWDQWQLLREFDCDLEQGFLAAPPLPGDQIPDCLGQWQARLRAEQVLANAPAPGAAAPGPVIGSVSPGSR
jgi:EAL domain-containing protein (putative c-di-GMP-specific phosphodiesterase class I)/DNA-binding NarL/FixJ family response regulator